jgi:hypothetical protein
MKCDLKNQRQIVTLNFKTWFSNFISGVLIARIHYNSKHLSPNRTTYLLIVFNNVRGLFPLSII